MSISIIAGVSSIQKKQKQLQELQKVSKEKTRHLKKKKCKSAMKEKHGLSLVIKGMLVSKENKTYWVILLLGDT